MASFHAPVNIGKTVSRWLVMPAKSMSFSWPKEPESEVLAFLGALSATTSADSSAACPICTSELVCLSSAIVVGVRTTSVPLFEEGDEGWVRVDVWRGDMVGGGGQGKWRNQTVSRTD